MTTSLTMTFEYWIALPILGLVILLIVVFIYNRLILRRNMVKEAWSNVDVQLKRRHVLIPNLLSSVQAYMHLEQTLLVGLTKTRNQCVKLEAKGPTKAFFDQEHYLSVGLRQFWGVVENYPDIKANDAFSRLQHEMSDTEDKIQMARRYYNGNVRDMNILVESFPSNIIATLFGFKTLAFFQVDNPMERVAPKTKFEQVLKQ